MNRKQNQKIEVGEIWSTKRNPRLPGGETLAEVKYPKNIVVLLDDSDAYDKRFPDIRVAPISTETKLACDADLIINSGENPMGTEIMIELWNSQPMLKINLDQRLGKLSEEIIGQLGRLNQKVWGQEVNLEGIKTGTSITNLNDPRVEFQENEIESTLYLRGPVNELLDLWGQEMDTVAIIKAALSAVFAAWWQQHDIRFALAGAHAAGLAQPQDGQTEDGALRWRVVEEDTGDLVVRFGSHHLELEGVKLMLKVGILEKTAVLESVTEDQVGAEITFTRDERAKMPEDAVLAIDLFNED